MPRNFSFDAAREIERRLGFRPTRWHDLRLFASPNPPSVTGAMPQPSPTGENGIRPSRRPPTPISGFMDAGLGFAPPVPTSAAGEAVDPALGSDVLGMLPPVAAYRAGRDMIGPGLFEGRPGQAAAGIAAAVPFRLPGRGRMVGPATHQMDRPYGAGWEVDRVRKALDRTRLPGTEPPGGPLPYLGGGALAGGLAGYGMSDGDPLATLGGALGGGAATYMGARDIDRRRDYRPPGPTNIPPTGVSREAARFTRNMPTTGRAPTGGGAFASYDEQRRAVDYFMRQGHRPPRPTWGEAAPGFDQYVRDALAAYRARRRP